MDTTNPFFARAEVAHRHEQARQDVRAARRRRARRTRRQRQFQPVKPVDRLW